MKEIFFFAKYFHFSYSYSLRFYYYDCYYHSRKNDDVRETSNEKGCRASLQKGDGLKKTTLFFLHDEQRLRDTGRLVLDGHG